MILAETLAVLFMAFVTRGSAPRRGIVSKFLMIFQNSARSGFARLDGRAHFSGRQASPEGSCLQEKVVGRAGHARRTKLERTKGLNQGSSRAACRKRQTVAPEFATKPDAGGGVAVLAAVDDRNALRARLRFALAATKMHTVQFD